MTEAELDRWMGAYGEAYVGRDADAGAALFAAEIASGPRSSGPNGPHW